MVSEDDALFSGAGFPEVRSRLLAGRTVPAVSLYELYSSLRVASNFSTWAKRRFSGLALESGVDYEKVISSNFGTNHPTPGCPLEGPKIGTNHLGSGRPLEDWVISVDAAKHIAMAERNEAGREVRSYFIRCEVLLRRLAVEATIAERDAHAAASASFLADEVARQVSSVLQGVVHDLRRDLDAANRRIAFHEADDEVRRLEDQLDRALFERDSLAGDLCADLDAGEASCGDRSRSSGFGSPGSAKPSPRSPRDGSPDLRDGRPDLRTVKRRRGRSDPPLGDAVAISTALARAGLRLVPHTGYGSLSPGETTAGSAIARLVRRWGSHDAGEILAALARSRHRLALTTFVIRPLADMASGWPGLVSEPGFADVLAGLDLTSIDSKLQGEGVVFVLDRLHALRSAIESALREALAPSRSTSRSSIQS